LCSSPLELEPADPEGDRREHEIHDAEGEDEAEALRGRHGDAGTPRRCGSIRVASMVHAIRFVDVIAVVPR
jgi:hypothetical protein